MRRSLLTALVTSALSLVLVTSVYADPSSEKWPKTDQHSPLPSKAEWKDAPTVSLHRVVGERAKKCRAYRVREWLKVRCTGAPTAAVNLVGGEARNVYFWVEPPDPAAKDPMPRDGEVVLAVQPGTTRVVQFWTFGPGYDGPLTVLGDVLLQQSWEEDQPLPTFTLTDALVEPIRTATQQGK